MAKVIDATLRLIDQFSPTIRTVNQSINTAKTAMSGMKSNVSSMVGKMEEMNKVNQRTARNFQRIGKSMASMQNVAVVASLTAAAEKGYESSKKINGAVNQMKIWGDVSDETAAKLKKGILEISSQYAIANDVVAESTQKAVKAGIKESEALEWMDSTAKFARVAKLELAQATQYGAQISKAYHLTIQDQAAAYNQLTTAAKVCHGDVDKITTTIANISPKAAQAGVSLTQLTATIAMMHARGYDEAQAGGIMENMITAIAKAQPKLAQMGIDVSAARIQAQGLAPVIADVYAKMGDDSKFKALFKNVDSYKMAMMMASNDGVSEWQGMLSQINAGSVSTLNKMWSQMQTPGEKTQQAMTDLANAWVTVGDALAPVFTRSATMIKTVVTAYNGLSDSQKGTIANIIQFVIVFGAATVAMGGMLSMIGTWHGMISEIIPTIKGIGSAIGFIGGHLKSLLGIFKFVGVAAKFLFANPIGIAIMVVIGLVYLIYTYWEPISGFFKTLWAGIVNNVTWAVNAIKNLLNSIGQAISTAKSVISAVIMWLVGFVSGNISSMINFCRGLFSLWLNNIRIVVNGARMVFSGIVDFVTGVFTGNWAQAWHGVVEIFSGIFATIEGVCNNVMQGIKSAINSVIGGINNISVDIPDWVPKVGGQHYAPSIPMLATGTNNWRGGPAMIHDAGPEIVDLPSGSRVIPHSESMKQEYQRGKSEALKAGISLTIAKLADTIIVREDADIDKIATVIVQKLSDHAQNQAIGAI